MRCSRARSGWLLQTCADGARAHGPRHTRGLVRDSGGGRSWVDRRGRFYPRRSASRLWGRRAINTCGHRDQRRGCRTERLIEPYHPCPRRQCALVFAACGMVGAGLGSRIGKSFDGRWLLFLFGLLMIVIALLMLREPHGQINRLAHLDPDHFLSNFKSPQSASETCPRVATPGCSGAAATRLSCRLRS